MLAECGEEVNLCSGCGAVWPNGLLPRGALGTEKLLDLTVALACSVALPSGVVWAAAAALRVPRVQRVATERRAAGKFGAARHALSELGGAAHARAVSATE